VSGCGERQLSRAKRGTYTVGKVDDQVVDLNFADLEFAVQPAVVWLVA
jgi:hypothetical protein